MDDIWKYNGDAEGVKKTQYSSVSTSVHKPDPSQPASSSFSEREAVPRGGGATRLPSPTPPFSSLSQDKAATSKATLSSTSGPDFISELGEGRSSPQTEISRSKVSWWRCFILCCAETEGFKLDIMFLTNISRRYSQLHGLIMWHVRCIVFLTELGGSGSFSTLSWVCWDHWPIFLGFSCMFCVLGGGDSLRVAGDWLHPQIEKKRLSRVCECVPGYCSSEEPELPWNGFRFYPYGI